MSVDASIDALLKQDEDELRAKRKRLKAFATTLDELRASSAKAAAAAAQTLENGDLSRSELAAVFSLTKGERASLFPAAPRGRVTPEPNSFD